MEYKLVLLDTLEGVECVEWPLHLPAVLGRSRDVDISIAHPSISRRHCQFFQHADGSLAIKDLGSTNGIYVGDQRVREAILMPGSVVQLGSITLRVEWNYDTIDEVVDSRSIEDLSTTQPVKIIPPRVARPFDDPPSGEYFPRRN